MTADVVREIARTHRTIQGWASSMGLTYNSVYSRFHRRGIRPGGILREERVRLTLQYRDQHRCTFARAALATGWSSPQSFGRAKQAMLRRQKGGAA